MSLKIQESFDFAPTFFNRESKLRKSFRIRHRLNKKLPPAAVIYMKSLEHYQNNKHDSLKSKSTFYVSSVEKPEEEAEDLHVSIIEAFENLYDDEQKLIDDSPVLTRRSSNKKKSNRKKIKLNKIIDFFRLN